MAVPFSFSGSNSDRRGSDRCGQLPWAPTVALALAVGLISGGTGGCAGVPMAADPVEALDRARLKLAAGRPEEALAILRTIESGALPRDLRPRLAYTLGRTHYLLGEPLAAFDALRTFAEDFPLAPERADVQTLVFHIGRDLVRSDYQQDGRVILEHLITNFASTPDRDDALHLLGDIAYAAGDYELANHRYQELIRDFRDSEWNELARFRVAMTRFHKLRGPGYDLAAMRTARLDLEALLENPPARPELLAEANEALDTVLEWLADHHLLLADYYRTLGNEPGEALHLRRASEGVLANTPAGQEAQARLAELGDPAAPAEVGAR